MFGQWFGTAYTGNWWGGSSVVILRQKGGGVSEYRHHKLSKDLENLIKDLLAERDQRLHGFPKKKKKTKKYINPLLESQWFNAEYEGIRSILLDALSRVEKKRKSKLKERLRKEIQDIINEIDDEEAILLLMMVN